MSDKHTNRRTNRQFKRQLKRLLGIQTHRHTDRERQTDRDRQTDLLLNNNTNNYSDGQTDIPKNNLFILNYSEKHSEKLSTESGYEESVAKINKTL